MPRGVYIRKKRPSQHDLGLADAEAAARAVEIRLADENRRKAIANDLEGSANIGALAQLHRIMFGNAVSARLEVLVDPETKQRTVSIIRTYVR
jgi:hypothetical protein